MPQFKVHAENQVYRGGVFKAKCLTGQDARRLVYLLNQGLQVEAEIKAKRKARKAHLAQPRLYADD
jgi:hypothetical protein